MHDLTTPQPEGRALALPFGGSIVFTTITVRQPSYGPQGQPFSVRARFADRMTEAHYWTEREAMEARDAAFDAGARAVHVAGLPFRGAAAGFPKPAAPLCIIDD